MPSESDPPSTTRAEEIRARLAALNLERKRLQDELRTLESTARGVLPLSNSLEPPKLLEPTEKVALFLRLFAARRSVFPKFWENPKSGKKGYAPACGNEWRHGVCEKPRIKCSDCPHQKFPRLDAQAVDAHLRGTHAIGTYAIREDDSCIFLAADFDGDGWWDDARAFRDAGEKEGVFVAIERSRSGNGAHAWIFFAEPVPAALARQLGTLLLAITSAGRPTLTLRAYDRFFPNQDTLPSGGFGNLIALPLAKGPRQRGNTAFLDASGIPHPDQWAFLAAIRAMGRDELDETITRLTPLAPLGGNLPTASFSLQADERALDLSCPKIPANALHRQITLRLDATIHVPRGAMPASVLAALRRLATLANPVFYEKQRLRFPTYDTPRFIFAGEWHPDRLVLPRGVLEAAIAIIEDAGATVAVRDARPAVPRVRWRFDGELRPEQKRAVRVMANHEHGVLSAPPGAGKTVMSCALIAQHRTSALVLVHRAVLIEQWRQEAARFLRLTRKEIGVWRGKASKLTGRLDIAMLPSMARLENPAELFSRYGLVVIDECHHVPAVSFEALLKACPCRRIIGLTATPQRKDGLEKLLYLQCGPIRCTLDLPNGNAVPRTVFIRRSSFHLPEALEPKTSIHEIWRALVDDTGRTEQIAADIWLATQEGRCPLVLSDRITHLENLAEAFARSRSDADVAVFRFTSGDGLRRRRALRAEIDACATNGRAYVIFATAALIGEGFDLPRLDTLFLAMPLSFKGRLIQYAGRLHRSHDSKREVRIYDYLDENHAVTRSMFRRRATAYREMGYRFSMDENLGSNSVADQLGLFEKGA